MRPTDLVNVLDLGRFDSRVWTLRSRVAAAKAIRAMQKIHKQSTRTGLPIPWLLGQ